MTRDTLRGFLGHNLKIIIMELQHCFFVIGICFIVMGIGSICLISFDVSHIKKQDWYWHVTRFEAFKRRIKYSLISLFCLTSVTFCTFGLYKAHECNNPREVKMILIGALLSYIGFFIRAMRGLFEKYTYYG